MDKTRLMMLGIASAVAIGAALLARSYISAPPQPEPVREKVVEEKVERADVLVVARDINMGELIPAGALEWTAWPKEMLGAGMITREDMPEAIDKFVGRRARAPLFRGEPLVAEKVINPEDGGFLSALLPAGMRAVAIKISTETASGGFIQPNDRVDVLLTRKLGDHMISDTVLYNVRVLAIDQKALPGKDASGNPEMAEEELRTATLEVTEEQAKVLAKVQGIGEISLALRSLAERGESGLGDDGPRLSPKYARNAGGDVRTFRYGIAGTEPLNN